MRPAPKAKSETLHNPLHGRTNASRKSSTYTYSFYQNSPFLSSFFFRKKLLRHKAKKGAAETHRLRRLLTTRCYAELNDA